MGGNSLVFDWLFNSESAEFNFRDRATGLHGARLAEKLQAKILMCLPGGSKACNMGS